jgi:hypothetical protein
VGVPNGAYKAALITKKTATSVISVAWLRKTWGNCSADCKTPSLLQNDQEFHYRAVNRPSGVFFGIFPLTKYDLMQCIGCSGHEHEDDLAKSCVNLLQECG